MNFSERNETKGRFAVLKLQISMIALSLIVIGVLQAVPIEYFGSFWSRWFVAIFAFGLSFFEWFVLVPCLKKLAKQTDAQIARWELVVQSVEGERLVGACLFALVERSKHLVVQHQKRDALINVETESDHRIRLALNQRIEQLEMEYAEQREQVEALARELKRGIGDFRLPQSCYGVAEMNIETVLSQSDWGPVK